MGNVLPSEACIAPCSDDYRHESINVVPQNEPLIDAKTLVDLQPAAPVGDSVLFSIHNYKSTTFLCDGSLPVSECQYTQRLITILTRYNELMIQSRITNQSHIIFVNECRQHMPIILDDFNHILFHHHSDNSFEWVYDQLNQDHCDPTKCICVSRHYRNKHQLNGKYGDLFKLYMGTTATTDDSLIFVYQLLDKIHCHVQHSYDISKLTTQEQDMYKDDGDDVEILRGILRQKAIETNHVMMPVIMPIESSFPFFYWPYYRDVEKDFIAGYSFNTLYVGAKHDSLKDELVNNEIYEIDIEEWMIEHEKAIALHATKHCKKETKPLVNKYMVQVRSAPEHVSNYGFTDYDVISVHHVLAVAIYSSFDALKAAFLSTFDSSIGFCDVKQKHCNYHFLSKYLNEAVVVFGRVAMRGTIDRFYHHLSARVVFNSTQSNIYCALPCTSSLSVAIASTIGCEDGMIVEMVPAANLKYFSCNWISSYSNEDEILFIGGTHPIYFVNITLTTNGCAQQMKALRVIDTMTNGHYFDGDPAMYLKMVELNTRKIKTLGGEALSRRVMDLVIELIHHELSRYDDGYKRCDELPAYVDELLHHICQRKAKVAIDFESMDVEIKKKYASGYIGYSFLKHMICKSNYGLNYDFIYALFPNLQSIYITNADAIDGSTLDDLLQFLSANRSEVKQVQLSLSERTHSAQYSVMIEHALQRENQFKALNFKCSITQNSSGHKALAINTMSA
eukprot:502827_1